MATGAGIRYLAIAWRLALRKVMLSGSRGLRDPGRRDGDSRMRPARKRRPRSGAPSHGHVPPGYQACTFTAVVGGLWSAPRYPLALLRPLFACHGTPPAAGRAWVPGFRVRAKRPVLPFYWSAAALESPLRDRFVISIDRAGCMQRGPGQAAGWRLERDICGCREAFTCYALAGRALPAELPSADAARRAAKESSHSCPATLDGSALTPAA